MTFSRKQLFKIPHILSEPRFATYLRYCDNDKARALALYQWNMELSAAFIVPLHLLEVSLRNAVVESLEAIHSQNWPWNSGFIRSLPNPKGHYSSAKNLQEVARSQPTTGKVVAELKFVFWQKMFTARHDKVIWNHQLKHVFPYAPQNMNVSTLRSTIYSDVDVIRDLRNRIAHHEPIFSRDIGTEYETMHKLVSWRDPITADWMQSIQYVTQILSQKPL